MNKEYLSGDGWSAVVYNYLDEFEEDAESYVEKVAEKIPEVKGIGYMGFDSRDAVKDFIKWSVFSKNGEWNDYEVTGVNDLIKEVFDTCSSVMEKEQHVFILPTFNSFVLEEMNGVTGYTQWENTIVININPKEGWQDKFKEVLAHELSHSIRLVDQHWNDVKDQLVMDGLAENFRLHFMGGDNPPWVEKITRDKAEELFKDVMEHLGSQDEDIHKAIFYGSGQYPTWTGAAIGYYLVKDYLESLEEVDWKEVLKKPSYELIIESPFTTPFAKE